MGERSWDESYSEDKMDSLYAEPSALFFKSFTVKFVQHNYFVRSEHKM